MNTQVIGLVDTVPTNSEHPLNRRLLIVAVFVGVGLRCILASVDQGNFDQRSYEIVVSIMRRGGNIYAETTRYNYTPIWAYCLFLLANIADYLHLSLPLIVRFFLIIIDLFDALLISAISYNTDAPYSKNAGLIYLLNPVSILLVGYHGQFENLAILPLLIGVWIYSKHPNNVSILTFFVLGTLSTVIKHDTLFLIWFLYVYITNNRYKAELLISATLTIFVLSFIPYIINGREGILENVVGYGSVNGQYGLSMLLPPYLNRPIFFAIMIATPLIAKLRLHIPMIKVLELSSVSLITLLYGMSEQYFIIPIFLGTIFGSRFYWLYTVAATLFLVGSKYNIHFTLIPSLWNTVWFVAFFWWLSYFVNINSYDKK